MIKNNIWSNVLTNVKDLGTKLTNQNIKIACAESCTGGLLAAAFTSVSGSSNWFERGVVSYSNESKIDLLNVGAKTIAAHGAVSLETAGEMSLGLLAAIPSIDIAISTTGIAGPLGGTTEKPVGTVCFGLARRSADGIDTNTYIQHFDGDRDEIRYKSVLFVTKLLLTLEE